MLEDETIQASGSEHAPVRSGSPGSAGANAIFDAQRAIAAEATSSAAEMFERLRTEVHLWNEFVSKVAAAHSVRDFRAVWEECGRHQIEFARRQAELVFDHGKRALDAAAGLSKIRSLGNDNP
jgi:hypothetical protein